MNLDQRWTQDDLGWHHLSSLKEMADGSRGYPALSSRKMWWATCHPANKRERGALRNVSNVGRKNKAAFEDLFIVFEIEK